MSVMKKMLTMLRGSVREKSVNRFWMPTRPGSANRKYLEAKQHIAQARIDLTGVMAKEMQSARQIEKLQIEIDRHEKLAARGAGQIARPVGRGVGCQVGGSGPGASGKRPRSRDVCDTGHSPEGADSAGRDADQGAGTRDLRGQDH